MFDIDHRHRHLDTQQLSRSIFRTVHQASTFVSILTEYDRYGVAADERPTTENVTFVCAQSKGLPKTPNHDVGGGPTSLMSILPIQNGNVAKMIARLFTRGRRHTVGGSARFGSREFEP